MTQMRYVTTQSVGSGGEPLPDVLSSSCVSACTESVAWKDYGIGGVYAELSRCCGATEANQGATPCATNFGRSLPVVPPAVSGLVLDTDRKASDSLTVKFQVPDNINKATLITIMI